MCYSSVKIIIQPFWKQRKVINKLSANPAGKKVKVIVKKSHKNIHRRRSYNHTETLFKEQANSDSFNKFSLCIVRQTFCSCQADDTNKKLSQIFGHCRGTNFVPRSSFRRIGWRKTLGTGWTSCMSTSLYIWFNRIHLQTDANWR